MKSNGDEVASITPSSGSGGEDHHAEGGDYLGTAHGQK
jgi:hypothetical protein